MLQVLPRPGTDRLPGAAPPSAQVLAGTGQRPGRCLGLVVAANREHRMAVVRVDRSGGYSVVRWSQGNGPRVGEQLVGYLEKTGAGPLFDETTGADVDLFIVSHDHSLGEAIEAID